jgi:PAS domain S-box-containing protein
LYGWPKTEVLDRTPQAILQTAFPQPLAEINAELIRNRRWEGELVHTRRDGSTVVVASRWALQVDAHGNPRTVLGINSDITSRKHAEAALEHQALHDALTGLPNRSLFRHRLEHALARRAAASSSWRCAQAAQLLALGCDRGQGFLFARPQSAEAITALLYKDADLKESAA